MLSVVIVAKGLLELLLMALLGQVAVGVLAGARRAENPVYRMFRLVARPVVATARRCLPAAASVRVVYVLAFAGLFAAWVAVTVLKIKLILSAVKP